MDCCHKNVMQMWRFIVNGHIPRGSRYSCMYIITLFRHTSCNYYFSVIRMSTHFSDTHHAISTSDWSGLLHTSCNYVVSVARRNIQVIQLLLLSDQDVYTLFRHTSCNFYIWLVRTSTHIMQLRCISGQEEYTGYSITTSQWSGRLHTSCNYNISLFRHTSCNELWLKLVEMLVYSSAALRLNWDWSW